MPNHLHGIIFLRHGAGDTTKKEGVQIPPLRSYTNISVASGSLGAIIRSYKGGVTFRINSMRGTNTPPIWQRNYYEHIIRNDKEYENIWKYIDSNPAKWGEDKLHA